MRVVFELLYKLGVRIQAIAILTKSSLMDDNTIIFKEKGKKIIKRKTLPKTSDKLRKIITYYSLKDYQHIFYPLKYPDDNDKRKVYFAQKMSKITP